MRYYSSTAAATTLSSGISNSTTSLTVGSVTGFPVSYPYTLILEEGTASEEVVTVTAGSSTTLTVTRGSDGTTGVSHSSGAAVIHGVSARDFREPQEHIAAVEAGLTSYSPAWTGAGGNPGIGNGTLAGKWKQIGPLVFFTISLEMGSTTTYGTGTWSFTLPTTNGAIGYAGGAFALDASTGTTYGPSWQTYASATTLTVAGQGVAYGSSGPIGWATGDKLIISGFYGAA